MCWGQVVNHNKGRLVSLGVGIYKSKSKKKSEHEITIAQEDKIQEKTTMAKKKRKIEERYQSILLSTTYYGLCHLSIRPIRPN